VTNPDLTRLAELIRSRNAIDAEIAAIIGRPAEKGHTGEYVAAQIFDIALNESASNKAYDGRFSTGPLAGHSVDIKYYGKQEGILDISPGELPDVYLVLTGELGPAASSKGKTRPWTIQRVYHFDARTLHHELTARGIRIGIATSVRRELWESAEIFPQQTNKALLLTDEQRRLLPLFA
jgi:hypothetical protein